MTTVLCVPQWQGSASDQAPRLEPGDASAGEAEIIRQLAAALARWAG
jgi:hypothetical protein